MHSVFSVVLNVTDVTSFFLRPSPISPQIVCVPSEGALSFTRTLIRTVSTTNSTSLTSSLTNYIWCVCYLLLLLNWKNRLEEHSGGVVKSLPYVLFWINNHLSSEKPPRHTHTHKQTHSVWNCREAKLRYLNNKYYPCVKLFDSLKWFLIMIRLICN